MLPLLPVWNIPERPSRDAPIPFSSLSSSPTAASPAEAPSCCAPHRQVRAIRSGVATRFAHHRRHDQHTRKVAFAGWTAGRDARTADQPGRALPPAAQCSTGSATTMHLLSTTACTKRDQGGGGLVVVEGGGVVEEAP